jgi:hypothetical protein
MRRVEPGLPVMVGAPMLPDMFVVTEEDATAIRDTVDHGGELSAAVELHRLFPGPAPPD